MGAPTITRLQLRQSLALELGMPFFRRFPTGSTLTAVNGEEVYDTKLKQGGQFWKNAWFYHPESDTVRVVTNYNIYSGNLTLENSIPGMQAGDKYELHSIWNAHDLHLALNRALDLGYPSFFDQVSGYLTLIEDQLEYDLSALIPAPWTVQKLWLENNQSRKQYEVSNVTYNGGSGHTELTLASSLDPRVAVGWNVASSQAGVTPLTCAIHELDGSMIELDGNRTANFAAGVRISVWNPAEALPWLRLFAAGFDAKEYPDRLYLRALYRDHYGMRLRADYIAPCAELEADTDTTVVPREYAIKMAASILYGMKVNDNRADRQRFAALEDYWRQVAEQHRNQRGFRVPESTLWQASDPAYGSFSSSDNPLRW